MRKYPGSSIKNFKRVVELADKLLNGISREKMSSPYSVIPLISQALGLDAPVMGSGSSPYSVISLALDLDNLSLTKELFEMPTSEKRFIVDEIYDMLAPLLLNEEDIFIDLMVNTRYRSELIGGSRKKISDFGNILKEKFSILSQFISQVDNKKGTCAQIVHYGYVEDLYREYNFLESLPSGASKRWFDMSYPIVNEFVMTNFPDEKTGESRNITGWVILIANSTKQLLSESKLRKKKILQCARLAEKLGAKIIGMGGLIASFAQGGHWLSNQIPDIGFTTGHAYTIGNIMNIMEKSTERVNLNIQRSVVAIVGAGGSIGSGCAELIMRREPKEIVLIDASSFVGQAKLKQTLKRIENLNAKTKISLSTNLSDMKKADLSICATNSPYSIIKKDYLKTGAIIIDDSYPKNISRDILKKRKDVIFLEGGVAQLPHSIDFYMARNAPDLEDAHITRIYSCKEIYGCLGEILVLALMNHEGNYGLGYADTTLASDIMSKSKNFGFTTAPLQCFDRAIEAKRFQKVCEVIAKRRQ